jgi:hypothetical protein
MHATQEQNTPETDPAGDIAWMILMDQVDSTAVEQLSGALDHTVRNTNLTSNEHRQGHDAGELPEVV